MSTLYRHSLALLTDLYELTMAYGYWKREMAEDEAVFHLIFRKNPFQGGYTLAAGLESVIEYIQNWRFEAPDLDYLSTLTTERGAPLFEEGFLRYLGEMRFNCDIDAVQEGDVVFPFEPMVRVKGPLLQAQLLETPLLTLTNFASLIATKASRVSLAAGGDPVLEFGLRRAQGIDGGLTAARSAYLGGCHATSNTLAGKLYGIPVKGTHAHSWIMAFDTEKEAFQAYAEALPENCVFLVDTYDSLQGVKNAIQVAKWLKKEGRPFLGVRLDSGDINYLSQQARKLMDAAGFPEAKIYASNTLNEILIADLKRQGAQVAVWGVGTNLVTGQSQSALDGVYKISAIRKKGAEEWKYRLKLSERMTKTSDPGILQVRRFFTPDQTYIADALYDVHTDLSKGCEIIDPIDPTRRRQLSPSLESRDLLVPIFRAGERVYQSPPLDAVRTYGQGELAKLDASLKRFYNPHSYPVGMESSLYAKKLELIEEIRTRLQHESASDC